MAKTSRKQVYRDTVSSVVSIVLSSWFVHALLPAGPKLLPRPQAVYGPWSSKRGNNVTFLPIPVVLPIVVVYTRITVSLRAPRESTRDGFNARTAAVRVGGRGGYGEHPSG